MSNLENQQEENQQEASSEKPVGYVERFEQERAEWTEKVRGIAYRFKNIDDMIDVQVDLYSERQRSAEYMHELQVLQSKLKKAWIAEYKKAYDATIMDQDYRYSEKERQRIAEDKSAGSKLKLDILQVHVDFFRETTKTIDNMIFGVKHRLEIEDFRRGNK
jgi:hypothetical protein